LGGAIIGVGLAHALEVGRAGSSIQSMSIRKCGLKDEGAQHLLDALRKGVCPKLTLLYVGVQVEEFREVLTSRRLPRRVTGITVH